MYSPHFPLLFIILLVVNFSAPTYARLPYSFFSVQNGWNVYIGRLMTMQAPTIRYVGEFPIY